MHELLKDVSTITTIPKLTLESINESTIICMCHDILEDKLSGADISELDIGIGILYIKLDDDIKFKFVPNSKFENIIKTTLEDNTSPLISKAENILKTKVIKTYKDLL